MTNYNVSMKNLTGNQKSAPEPAIFVLDFFSLTKKIKNKIIFTRGISLIVEFFRCFSIVYDFYIFININSGDLQFN